MHVPTFRITTLGCRVNHAEVRDLQSLLLARGLEAARPGRPADLEVVHTCSVTRTAAAKSRQAIRRAAKRQRRLDVSHRPGMPSMPAHSSSPSAAARPGRDPEVIVTGCFAGTDPHAAGQIVGRREQVIPHASDHGSGSMLERFARRVDKWLSGAAARDPIRPAGRSSSAESPSRVMPLPMIRPRALARRRTRAELRIQDGCDAHCTFCIIPSIRRQLRSKPLADVVDEATRLVDLGHPEIVLTGIFLGAYGHETALRRRQARLGSSPLADLVDAVARVSGLQRVRLSSLEPGDVDERLLDAMLANRPVVVPHLHLPLQSGSDPVLRRMNRQYRVGEYLEMIHQVLAALTDDHGLPPALTTDVICGFPGETDEDFQRTVAVARHVGFLHMHVFPFSPRRGTAAARWTDRFIDPEVIRSRVRYLIDLEEDPDDGLSMRFRRRLRGRDVRVILEQPDRSDPSWMTGRCDHYALISVPEGQPRGTLMQVTIEEVTATRTIGAQAPKRLTLPVLSPAANATAAVATASP